MLRISFVPEVRIAADINEDLYVLVPDSLCDLLVEHLRKTQLSPFIDCRERGTSGIEGFCVVDFHSRPEDDVLVEAIRSFLKAKNVQFEEKIIGDPESPSAVIFKMPQLCSH